MSNLVDDLNEYTIYEHAHRFAAWCGATAGSRSKICRFSVKKGKEILEKSGIHPKKNLQELTYVNDNEFDIWHNNICESMIKNTHDLENFCYGIAAKILNCYLKACYNNSLGVLNIIHPPIDRVLLQTLSNKNIGGYKKEWNILLKIGWSKFEKEDYISCIKHIRNSLPPQTPLWKIECYWKGHQ